MYKYKIYYTYGDPVTADVSAGSAVVEASSADYAEQILAEDMWPLVINIADTEDISELS